MTNNQKARNNQNIKLRDFLTRLTYDLYRGSPDILKMKLRELDEVFE